MYIKKLSLLFIHIPKTAGQSITEALLNYENKSFDVWAIDQRNLDPNYGPPQKPHMTIDEYEKFTDIDLNNTKIFTVVRNPLDRLWSEYNFAHYCNMDWNQFLIRVINDEFIDNYQMGADNKRHILPQSDFINDKYKVRILRFEHLKNDWHKMLRDWNLPNIELPHRNKNEINTHFKYYEMFTNNQKKSIIDLYADDFKNFGYIND